MLINKLQKWLIFTKERFDPFSHLIMIFVFISAHLLVVNPEYNIKATSLHDIMLFLGVTLFYFKLRLYDEVKDYELDIIINKHRPLPRGLLNHQDMFKGMAFCIFLELIIFSIMGIQSLISISLVIAYSLIMYKEFFIKEIIRPHLTTYALMHTIVTSLLSFAIFSFATQESFFSLITNKTLLLFAIANWMLFNIFEFGRKTYSPEEERENVDTYSSLFGATGASLLVLSQSIVAVFCSLNLKGIHPTFAIITFSLLTFIQLFLSGKYIIQNNAQSAKHFRLFSSIYIIVFYCLIIIGHILPGM